MKTRTLISLDTFAGCATNATAWFRRRWAQHNSNLPLAVSVIFIFYCIQPQYVFIHDALLEAIECGVTEVLARELHEQYKQLCEVDVEQKVTGLSMQFDNLDKTIHRKLRRNTGTLHFNKAKNRYGANPDAIPCTFESSLLSRIQSFPPLCVCCF